MTLRERRHNPRTEPFDTAVVLGRCEQDTHLLTEYARPLVGGDVSPITSWQTASSTPSPQAVLAAVEAADPDVVIRASTPLPSRVGPRVDSLDAALIRRSPCPVWFVDPSVSQPPRRVLAAINPILEDRIDQAAAVLFTAQRVARGLGAELHVMHAWIAFGDTLLRPRVSAEELEDYVGYERDGATRRVHWSLARAGVRIPSSRVHLRRGHFAELLASVAREQQVGLVVMGTRGRHGRLGAALVPPYPEVVLRKGTAPLLVVKGSA